MKIIILNDDKGLGRLWALAIRQAGHSAMVFEEPKEFTISAYKNPEICHGIDAVLADRFYGQGFDLGSDLKLVSEIRRKVFPAKLILCSKLHGDADDPSSLPEAPFDDILYPLPVNVDRLQCKLPG